MNRKATNDHPADRINTCTINPKFGFFKLVLTRTIGALTFVEVVVLLITAQSAPAQMLTTLHDFTGGNDGAQPFSTLVIDQHGNLVGTAYSGGIQNPNCTVNGTGCGTLFKLTPSGGGWVFNLLYDFKGYPGDGSNPDVETLAFDANGNLYGTTTFGGDLLSCERLSCGLVFKLATDGTETVLYKFEGEGEAFSPFSGVVRDANGSLFGVTFHGGPYQAGTIYEVMSDGTEKILYNFTGGADGGYPYGGLVLDKDGNLYGTTQYGGSQNCTSGCGTVFKLAPDGTETVLYSFLGGADGATPWAGLVRDQAGNLYGTTLAGGGSSCGTGECGIVFQVTPTGTETILHRFDSSDRSGPRAALVLDADGNLYGTAPFGGAYEQGMVFKLTPAEGEWTETILHSFNESDGNSPFGGVVLDGNGSLYGTTQLGGAYHMGTVFQLSLPAGTTTSTSLVSSLNPSTYGQSVTFTTTVTSNSGTPAGTVQIRDGSTILGTGTLANGSVSIPAATAPAGADSIVAFYLGGGSFAPSKSAPLSQTVRATTTSVSLASSLPSGVTNQPVTFTAVVASQHGGGTSGTVTFMAGAQTLGSASLVANQASLTTSFASAGIYSVTAHYVGDSNNKGSTSAVLMEKIITSTTTMLASSLNPSVAGLAVTFTATLTSSAGIPPNGEPISFFNGSSILGTVSLNRGSAALTTSALQAGVFTIKASYPGDSAFGPSVSSGLRQVVNSTTKSSTSTTVASSLNPSIYGQNMILTALVTTSGPLPPTGAVAFTWSDGFTKFTIGTAKLNSSGAATLVKSNVNAGAYPLTAVYQGDTNNLRSTSAVLSQTVLPAISIATITSSLNPSALGQAVTFTANITSPTVMPTGPVTFKAGTTLLGQVQLKSGKAVFTTSSLVLGSTRVKVTFSGDSNIKGSASSVLQVVKP